MGLAWEATGLRGKRSFWNAFHRSPLPLGEGLGERVYGRPGPSPSIPSQREGRTTVASAAHDYDGCALLIANPSFRPGRLGVILWTRAQAMKREKISELTT